MTSKRCPIAVAVALVIVPAWADADQPVKPPAEKERASMTTTRTAYPGGAAAGSNIGWNGWGVRAGVTDDVDQVVGGAHFNLGEFVPHLRFQPDLQLGVGDDHTTLYGTAPVYYRFGVDRRFTPYAGGGVALGFVDRDLPAGSNADDSDFEVGGRLTGGLEWPRPEGQAMLLELSFGFGDVHDAQLTAAWSF